MLRKHMKKSSTSLRRVSPRCRRSVFFSKQQRTQIFGCRGAASMRHRAVRKDRHEAGLGMRMLMRHRAGRHDWHAGVQQIPNADVPSCRQKRQTRRRVTNYECSSEPSCRQKRHTRWHATNSECVHHCMCPVLPDGNDTGRKATREVTAISATQAHPASARHQLGWRATEQHPPGQLAPVAFQYESNQVRNSNTHQKASSIHGEAIHPPRASPAATHCGRARFSRW